MTPPHSEPHPWWSDLGAALAVTLISVPQGIGYALIAGLPPAMGLYAGALPAIIGSLTRSSRHVVTGPTNAVSLLVGTSVAATMDDPVAAAGTLALLVGVFQVGAGVLRLGALVDYISTAVVLGYITGAGVLIGVGQLPNLTRTGGVGGDIATRMVGWARGLHDAHLLSVAIGLGSVAAILSMRRLGAPRGSGAMATIGLGVLLVWLLGLHEHGVVIVGDLTDSSAGLPPLSLPSVDHLGTLAPIALAATVLSLVEATSVARSISARTGQHIDIAREFVGQGLGNLAAAVSGAYPVSGSLSRSALNERAGARTRFAGVASGVMMILVLLALGPVVDWIPIPSLAGLLLVVAWDLMDWGRMRVVVNAGPGDALAFCGTVVGTWTLPLDQAIYLGVGISVVIFLRRARLLVLRELLVDDDLHLQEFALEDAPHRPGRCGAIRVLHVEGPLFFGAASELDDALRPIVQDRDVLVLIVRLKRAQGVDLTTAQVLADTWRRMHDEGRTLMLVGLTSDTMARLRAMGLTQLFGEDLYPTEPGWFVAMNAAMEHALELVGDHDCPDCPVEHYVAHRHAVHRAAR